MRLYNFLVKLRVHRVHHCVRAAALRMTEEEAFRRVCHLQHQVEHCWEVVHSELVEAEVPKLLRINA